MPRMTLRIVSLVCVASLELAIHAQSPTTRVLIKNADVIDGTGVQARRADVRVAGDTVAETSLRRRPSASRTLSSMDSRARRWRNDRRASRAGRSRASRKKALPVDCREVGVLGRLRSTSRSAATSVMNRCTHRGTSFRSSTFVSPSPNENAVARSFICSRNRGSRPRPPRCNPRPQLNTPLRGHQQDDGSPTQ
jgi:hypothetical protein